MEQIPTSPTLVHIVTNAESILTSILWPDGPVCPVCGSHNHTILKDVGFTVGKTNTVEHLENILDHLKQTATGDIVASICVIVQRIATDSLTKLTAARSFHSSRMTR